MRRFFSILRQPLVARYAAPTILLIVAIHQLTLVHTTQLSRWRGGGFGMYSEIHPKYRRIWAQTGQQSETRQEPSKSESLTGSTNVPPTLRLLALDATRLPSRRNLEKVQNALSSVRRIDGTTETVIQVWGLSFNIAKGTIQYVLLAEEVFSP